MQYIKTLEIDIPFSVNKFEEKTYKKFPYYQNGKKYALCPLCSTSIQIIGGQNNTTNSIQDNGKIIYAAHTVSAITGLPFDENLKKRCFYYKGNEGNWQKIYSKHSSTKENENLRKYIDENRVEIAHEIEKIIGFKCIRYNKNYKKKETLKIFDELYNSFLLNNGLRIEDNYFIPEYIPKLIIIRAGQIKCWGYIPINDTKNFIFNNNDLQKFIQIDGKFKPEGASLPRLVGVLDDDNNPKFIIIKLIIGNKEFQLNKISAKSNQYFLEK